MYVVAISNKIQVNNSDCNTKVIKYRDNKNSYGFDYTTDPEFYQQVRLGVYLRSPKLPTKEKVYRQTDGNFRYGTVTIDKSVELHTDQFDFDTHAALLVASKHSDFQIDDRQYFSQGEIDLEDNDFNNLSNGKLTLLEQGFNKTNLQC
jgi:hypothetical protein